MNAKIVAIESKFSDVPSRVAVTAKTCEISNTILSPSVVDQNDLNVDNDSNTSNNVPTNENHTGSGQSSTCNVCVTACVNETRMDVPVETSSVSSFLSSSDLPLPLFDDNTDTNPVFHLWRLDEFIRLKGVPKAYWLAVAYR
jgi:hypothetical protein